MLPGPQINTSVQCHNLPKVKKPNKTVFLLATCAPLLPSGSRSSESDKSRDIHTLPKKDSTPISKQTTFAPQPSPPSSVVHRTKAFSRRSLALVSICRDINLKTLVMNCLLQTHIYCLPHKRSYLV